MKFALTVSLGLFLAAAEADKVFPEEDPLYYCHSELDWGAIPEREDIGEATLSRVLVFARHGARTNTHNTPKCWDDDETEYICPSKMFESFISPTGGYSPTFVRRRGERGVWKGNCLMGQLVDAGVSMHMSNGAAAGKAYKDVLGLRDVPKLPEVLIRSTDVPRTIQSAESFAMGFYPSITESEDELEITIPDTDRDSMTPTAKICPRLNDALAKFYQSPEAEEHVKQTEFERQVMGYATGRPNDFDVSDPTKMEPLYSSTMDCLMSHVCATVPAWPRSVPFGMGPDSALFQRVSDEATFWTLNRYGTNEEISKLAYGPLIGDILEDLNEPKRRLSFYSGHDTGPTNTLADVLNLTWMDSGNPCAAYWPPFGSILYMEVYSDGQTRFVYNGRVTSVEAIEECKGKATCDSSVLYEFLASVVPNEYECQEPPMEEIPSHLRASH